MPGSKAVPVIIAPEISEQLAFPCSYAQQRLWFIDQTEVDNGLYNIPLRLRLQGELDKARLERSLQEIIKRHEVLRTIFHYMNEGPMQIVNEQLHWSLDYEDLAHAGGDEQQQRMHREMLEQVRRGFDLARGPLLRATLLKLKEQEHVLLVTMHHIVADEWSIRVMVRELMQLYDALCGKGNGSREACLKNSWPIGVASWRGWSGWKCRRTIPDPHSLTTPARKTSSSFQKIWRPNSKTWDGGKA